MHNNNILILVGGPTAEHEISILSGRNVLTASINCNIVKKVFVIIISKNKKWYLLNDNKSLFELNSLDDDLSTEIGSECILWNQFILSRENQNSTKFNDINNCEKKNKSIYFNIIAKIDVVFPVLHGPYGESGAVQGALEIADIPYIGEDILISSIIMNKYFFKVFLQKYDIPCLPFIVLRNNDYKKFNFQEICKNLSKMNIYSKSNMIEVNELIVKTADQGSSIGVFHVSSEENFHEICDTAFLYGNTVIVEPFIKVEKELECSILIKNDKNKIISSIGEINIIKGNMYSYVAKYLDDSRVSLKIPAQINKNISERIKSLALKIVNILGIKSMARVDIFLTLDGELVVNELNSIPGFTEISMYPKLLEFDGITQENLIEIMIKRAKENFLSKKKIINDFEKTIPLQD
ncbi:D-alanine--D-alanine ligase [Lyticum sinuosum]|uniref:D-alanine--D-alanine ligase n=1 Tax=Lyticum sinuosum TaxID=1332059 RepID=A0AAE4VKC4_9RICK|nr:D-alanine--D-alanine ligase [Lyticum sinuosum]MDZ5760928.1 D-alanine--D-alanine ligase A [Lyticum sinuosum]